MQCTKAVKPVVKDVYVKGPSLIYIGKCTPQTVRMYRWSDDRSWHQDNTLLKLKLMASNNRQHQQVYQVDA